VIAIKGCLVVFYLPNKLFDAGPFCELGVAHKCDSRPLSGEPGNTCGTQVALPNIPELPVNRFQEFDEVGFARDLVELLVACCVCGRVLFRIKLRMQWVGQLISGGLSLSFEVVGLASSG
jgi:hypothetical protein